jgi:hypothetical protein
MLSIIGTSTSLKAEQRCCTRADYKNGIATGEAALERRVRVAEEVEVNLEASIWYWRAGWILGAVLLVVGIIEGNAALIALGPVILALAALMPRWLRRQQGPHSP